MNSYDLLDADCSSIGRGFGWWWTRLEHSSLNGLQSLITDHWWTNFYQGHKECTRQLDLKDFCDVNKMLRLMADVEGCKALQTLFNMQLLKAVVSKHLPIIRPNASHFHDFKRFKLQPLIPVLVQRSTLAHQHVCRLLPPTREKSDWQSVNLIHFYSTDDCHVEVATCNPSARHLHHSFARELNCRPYAWKTSFANTIRLHICRF